MRPVAPRRLNPPNIRAIHGTFTTIYAILAGFFLAAPIIFVNYELIFQSGLLGFLILTAGFMFAATIWAKELCVCHGEYYILNRFIIAIIFCCVGGFIFNFYYMYNVIDILSMCGTINDNEGTSFHLMAVTTSSEKDDQFQVDRNAKICRNEQGFGMFLAVTLILVQILFLLTVAVYMWLKSWANCLCPTRVLHTPTCVLTRVIHQ